jgi:hypothetical protein
MSIDQASTEIEALRELDAFPLVEALFGRRSRRFARGGEIPDGPLAYRSRHDPLPLSELERMLVLGAMGGTTGWHSHPRHARHAARVEPRRRSRGALVSPARLPPPSSSSLTTRAYFFRPGRLRTRRPRRR